MNIKLKILVSLVVVLVILNVIMIGFIWNNRNFKKQEHGKGRPPRIERFLERQIQFNEDQLAEFRSINRFHKDKMDRLNKKVRNLTKELQEAIVMENVEMEQEIDLQLDSINMLIKHEASNHIRSIANLCDEKQKEKLIKALNRLPDRRGNRPGKNHSKFGDRRP